MNSYPVFINSNKFGTYRKRPVACTTQSLLLLTYLLTYSLTHSLHGAVLLEKPTGLQLCKKFLAFYGTGKFITAFTGARHLSLS